MLCDELTNNIKITAQNAGAELIGFTSAEFFEDSAKIGHRPSDLLPNVKSIIILACGRRLNENRNYVYKWGPDYSLTFIKLKDDVKQRRIKARASIEAVKTILLENNFKAVTEPHGWTGILSFKQAAYLAGLGVFGKGNFVVHPKLGHLNILACILTDALLEFGKPIIQDVCGECEKCIKSCKYGAFKKVDGKYKWIPEKCRCYDLIMNPVTLKWTYGPCNSKCVNVCPLGKDIST